MTKFEARELIGNRKGWLVIKQDGSFIFCARKPETLDQRYKLGTDYQRDNAAYWLSVLSEKEAQK